MIKNLLAMALGFGLIISAATARLPAPSDEAKANVTNNASAIVLMLEKTSVIKRPVLVKNGQIISLGFDEAQYRKLLTQ